MPNISKIIGTGIANIAKVYDSTLSSLDEVLGLTIPASFSDTKAVCRSLSTGTANSITFVDSSDDFNFVESSAFSVSFWVKAGWSSSLNTNIHFFIGHEDGASSQLQDMIKFYYDESQNRISFRYGNKSSKTQWYTQGQWLFHANGGNYAPAYAAAGLGSTYWSASNRGNANSDGYTLLTFTKSSTNSANSMTLYWNRDDCNTSSGVPPLQTNQSMTLNMSTTEDRLWSLGSNGEYGSNDQTKTGNSNPTCYNGLTIWDKELSSSEVAELYNNGTPMDATTHSASSNLVGYWNFESTGNATVSSNNFTVAGSSDYETI